MKILVINPGATSTKIAVFQDEEQLYKLTIDHSAEELDRFERVIDQADYRREAILSAISNAGYQLSDFDAVCGRGGLYRAIPSGTYAVMTASCATRRPPPTASTPPTWVRTWPSSWATPWASPPSSWTPSAWMR